MEQQLNNPFITSGYYSPAYFCDREAESEKIITALSNDRNISLISPRRMGKTGLIHHVFYQLNHKDDAVHCFYLDIFSTQNLSDFVNIFGKTILGKLDNFSESVIKKISSFFKSFRPMFSFDALTGTPTITVDIRPEHAEYGLQEIFDYLKASEKRCYIAIDEFQQITEYPEKGIEALLRSYIQSLPNVKFIFSGSKKHLMDAMFSSANRPFYQSTQKISLKEIPLEIYKGFATDIFANHGKELPANVFEYSYTGMSGHTWYLQTILNHLFAMPHTEYALQDVKAVTDSILEEETATYKTYCDMITKGQLRLLRAIAMEKKISEPYDSSFMRKYNLTAPSSVRLALSALMDKMLVLKDDNNCFYVYDRFFSLWLEHDRIN